MLTSAGRAYRKALVRIVDGSRRTAGWLLAGAVLATTVLLWYTATHLSLDTDTTQMLDPNLPFRQLDRDFARAFPHLEDTIVVVIDADRSGLAQAVADRLRDALRDRLDLFPSIYQAGHGPFFQRHGLLYLQTDDLWAFSERVIEWAPWLGTLTHDPSLRGLFGVLRQALDTDLSRDHQKRIARMLDAFSATIAASLAGQPRPQQWRDTLLQDVGIGDDRRRLLLIEPSAEHVRRDGATQMLAVIRDLARDLERSEADAIRIRLTGSLAMGDEELGSIAQGMEWAALLSFLLVCGILLLGLRSWRLSVAIVATLGMGLIWTAAFATFAVGSLNLIAVTFPILYIGLGVDFGIQFGMRYQEEREGGHGHADALLKTITQLGGALTLAAASAAVTFFAFTFTQYRGLADLGIIAGGGMMVALVANLTLLPALLTVLPLTPVQGRGGHGDMLIWLTRLPAQRRRITLGIAVLAVMAMIVLLPQTRFDFNPLHLKDPATESVSTFLDLFHDPQTTPYIIDVLAADQHAGQRVARLLAALDEVERTVTLESYVPEDQEEKLAIIDDLSLVLQPLDMSSVPPAPAGTAERIVALEHFQAWLTQREMPGAVGELEKKIVHFAGLVAQLKATPGWPERTLADIEQQLLGDLPSSVDSLRQLLTAEPVAIDALPQDLKVRYVAVDGRVRVQVFPTHDLRDNAAVRRFVRAVHAVAPQATGTPVSLLGSGKAVINACLQATGLALLLSSLLLLAVLRSIRDTALVLLPLGLTMALTLASSVLLDVPINFANIVALPLLLGLGIAFGIYVVLRQRDGMDIPHLLHSSTPRAVLFSALTTMASFGTLAFSSHPGMASLGQLLALAFAFSLVTTLVVLPMILAVLPQHRRTCPEAVDPHRRAGRSGAVDSLRG